MHTFAQKPNSSKQSNSANYSMAGQALSRQNGDTHPILHLQRTIGNPAIQRLIEEKTEGLQVSPAGNSQKTIAHDFSQIPMHAREQSDAQAKPKVGIPGDQYERAVDKIANQEALIQAKPILSQMPRPSKDKTFRTRIQPPTASDSQLRLQASIYRQGKTPVIDASGQLSPGDKPPVGPALTGRQLGEVHNSFGEEGFQRSVHALIITRGLDFVTAAMNHAPVSLQQRPSPLSLNHPQESASHIACKYTRGSAPPDEQEEVSSNKRLTAGLSAAGSGVPLPQTERNYLETSSGYDFSKVRIFNNPTSHQTAELLGARAFAIGRSIYFGRNEYQPATSGGRQLLAHEAAHTVQQQDASIPPAAKISIGEPGNREEQEADSFAHAIIHGATPQALSTGSIRMARVMRALSFRRTNDTVTTNNPDQLEPPAGTNFEVGRGHGGIHFDWDTEVEVTGAPGDPFADWEAGHLQIVRGFWKNVYWGTGKNRTHERKWMDPLPSRDSDPGMIWYDDPSASAAFSASGEKRTANLNDSPGTIIEYANPVAGRTGTRGWFNWGMSFVTWSSVRDTTGPSTNASFHHLGHVYWNIMFNGSWDTTEAIGSRVNLDTAVTNKSKVFDGQGSEYTPIITGSEANSNFQSSTT